MLRSIGVATITTGGGGVTNSGRRSPQPGIAINATIATQRF
jgi:hypothetical protein